MSVDYRYRAYAETVHDGDTYHLRVDLGFNVAITIPVRLRGVDCPELPTESGKAATAFVTDLLSPANVRWDDINRRPTELIIQSYHDRQSFARWVADVWMVVDGVEISLAQRLLDAGHAVVMIR